MNPNTDEVSQNLKHDSDETPEVLAQRLGLIARLLDRAARTVWAQADGEGPESPLQSLGLGIYHAHCQVQVLRPADRHGDLVDGRGQPCAAGDGIDIRDPEYAFDNLDLCTAVQLLAEVGRISRPLPLWRPDLVGGAQLVIDLGDLLREARHLGC